MRFGVEVRIWGQNYEGRQSLRPVLGLDRAGMQKNLILANFCIPYLFCFHYWNII